jgi:hypothetical protein
MASARGDFDHVTMDVSRVTDVLTLWPCDTKALDGGSIWFLVLVEIVKKDLAKKPP